MNGAARVHGEASGMALHGIRGSRAGQTLTVARVDGARTFRISDLNPGWLIVDHEGKRVGRLIGTSESFLSVRRGLAPETLSIPLTAVAEVVDGRISLNVPRAWLRALAWHQPPRTDAIQPRDDG